jgi:hypothetical protein
LSNDPILGTFNSLPEGATLNVSGCQFKITYLGGTGNDVVLTQLSAPVPTLAIQRINSTQAILSWTTNLSDVILVSNTNLAQNAWLPVSAAPVAVGTNYVVTVDTTAPRMFYQLVPRWSLEQIVCTRVAINMALRWSLSRSHRAKAAHASRADQTPSNPLVHLACVARFVSRRIGLAFLKSAAL